MPEPTVTPLRLEEFIPFVPEDNAVGEFPVVGQMVIFLESQKINFIKGIVSSRVHYHRPDGQTYRLPVPEFREKFRPATKPELEALLTLAQTEPDKLFKRGGIKISDLPGNEEEVGTLIEPGPNDNFDFIVIHKEAKESILAGLKSIENHNAIHERFALGDIDPGTKCILNFHGESGTGKTVTAKAVARELGKSLYQVDYSSIISKWVGDTLKYIKLAFKQAKRHDAVLFLDEADSLMSRRVSMSDEDGGVAAFATSVNQNRNGLMQEMDAFGGVIITTTNFFKNFDPAILRRVNRSIEFALPDTEMRKEILSRHFPKKDNLVEIDWDDLAVSTPDFSGGDLRNVAINSMTNAAANGEPDSWFVTQAVVHSAIKEIATSKKAHGGKRKQGKIEGFMTGDRSSLI